MNEMTGLQASTAEDNVKEQPLYTKVTSDLQKYSDVGRGFKMLRCVAPAPPRTCLPTYLPTYEYIYYLFHL